MNKIIFLTLNTFVTLPPIKQLLFHFEDENEVHCIQCVINDYDNFFDERKISQSLIYNFSSFSTFFNQTFLQKVSKYIKISFYAIRQQFKWRNYNTTIFAIDIFSLSVSLLAKCKHHKVVYLQYEVIEPQRLNVIDKYLFKLIQRYSHRIDLIITPEKNRSTIIMNLFKKSKEDSFFILPNTNNNQIELRNTHTADNNKPIIITHIGAVGLSHNIESFLEAISKLDQKKYEIRFIGILTKEVIELITTFKCDAIKLIGQVKHSELKKYYLETDIGVILYKDVSVNHRFCAPNKLYEYWSYGIQVIGDLLPGLIAVFTDPILGKLINMNKPLKIKEVILEMEVNNNKKLKVQQYFYSYFCLDNYLQKLNNKLLEN